MQNTKLNTNELDRMMSEAIKALNSPSPVLEKAPKMSRQELNEQIDKRIKMISSKEFSGDYLELIKVEARTLAIMLLRKG